MNPCLSFYGTRKYLALMLKALHRKKKMNYPLSKDVIGRISQLVAMPYFKKGQQIEECAVHSIWKKLKPL